MAVIVVGGVIKKDGKYLLVQEGKGMVRGKWNIPAGRLDPLESIFDGAKREIFEECGLQVELTGILQISNKTYEEHPFIGMVFSTNIIGGDVNIDNSEIIDAKWFTPNEIIAMKDQLRSYNWIVDAVDRNEKNKITSLDLINNI